jgi:hypothetical protein
MAAPRRVYVSYRRTDAGYAGRLYDELAERFGPEHVLIDVDWIEPGADWSEKLMEVVESSSAVIAVIGPGWADDDGRRRLNMSGDSVRHELATALKGSTSVFPVLVGGGTLPSSSELPPDLAPLQGLDAREIDNQDWVSGVEGLITTLERKVG